MDYSHQIAIEPSIIEFCMKELSSHMEILPRTIASTDDKETVHQRLPCEVIMDKTNKKYFRGYVYGKFSEKFPDLGEIVDAVMDYGSGCDFLESIMRTNAILIQAEHHAGVTYLHLLNGQKD
jgi:hypothetical protein